MRYIVRFDAYQVLDGAQVTIWLREDDPESFEPPKIVMRRHFTAVECDVADPATWLRDVLVQTIEHL